MLFFTFFTSIFISDSILLSFAEAIFSSNNDAFTSISVDELANDSILQKIWLFSATNVESKQQRTLNYYSKFRFAKDFFVNFLTDFAVLFNCDSAVAKIALILFVKAVFVDSYESKTYKETITNAQHKIN